MHRSVTNATFSALLLACNASLTGPLRAQDRPEDWWSFRPFARPAIPTVKEQSWLQTPIDAFILAKLEMKGLRPSPPADRATLIRRVTYDLHGLPPTPEEIDAFANDPDPNAYEKLIDRLLASP